MTVDDAASGSRQPPAEPDKWTKCWQRLNVIGVYLTAVVGAAGVWVASEINQTLERTIDRAEYFYVVEGQPQPIPEFGGLVTVTFGGESAPSLVSLAIYFEYAGGVVTRVKLPVSELEAVKVEPVDVFEHLSGNRRLVALGADVENRTVYFKVASNLNAPGAVGS